MAVRIVHSSLKLTVKISGEIDHHNAAVFRMEADEAIQTVLAPNVRIDFGEVTFMDSSGIGFIMGRYRVANSVGSNVEVVNLSNRNYSMMKLAGLDKLVSLKLKKKERIKI